ncbi:hypothetical protein [Azohydromonas caseinilytica]|uniref:Uncharacterized protein n=1 Tax=Azohydromonas caseinilytica TaxID=2728836 RepID=A0A848F5W8_9BURK|nr:hypothetical protein [Azohydromonas caseinilytica]NML13690.1 hypothetical protein [Azohydromonas caseinilytica]
MSLKERHGLSGRLHIAITDGAGRLVDERRVDNLITDVGRQLLARMFAGQVQPSELRIAAGSNGESLGADAATITTLADAPASVVVDAAVQEHRALARVTATLPATGDARPQAIQEAGIVIVLPERQVVYNRVTFPVINRAGNLELTFTWEVSF